MRLLIVEDEPSLATAIGRGLEAHGYATDTIGSAEAALELSSLNPYDLVLVDLGLPGADGFSLLRTLRLRQPVPVLILTARSEIADRVAGLEAGADDYLTKPFAFPELVARVRALLRRSAPSAPAVLRVGDLVMEPARFAVRRADVSVTLTVKEFAILEYLMRHAGELVTRSMLLDHCWDESYQGVSNLVDVHVGRLRRKLDVSSGSVLLHTVRGAGFILQESRTP